MLLSPYLPKKDPYAAGLLGYIGDPVANMPAAPNMVAPAPAPRPAFMQRVLNKMMPSQTAGGLLSDEDIKNARRQGLLGLGMSLLESGGPHPAGTGPNFLQGVGRGLGAMQQGYQGALQAPFAMRQAQQQAQAGQQALTLGQQQIDANTAAQARAGKLQQVRQAIIEKHGAPGAGGEAEWIDAVLPDLIGAGDDEMVGRLSEIRKTLGSKKNAQNPQELDLGNKVILRDPATGAIVGSYDKGVTPGMQAGLSLREEMTPVQQAVAENRIISTFDQQTKDYVKAHEAWSQVEGVVKRAEAGAHSPDDVVQLIDGISRLNNPGAVVRSSTVQLQLEKIGSMMQKAQMKYGQAANGMWPKEIVQGIARAAHAIADEHEKQYTKLRESAKVRGARVGLPANYLDAILPNTWDGYSAGPEYGVPGAPTAGGMPDVSSGSSSTAPTPGAGSLVQKYGSLQ